MKAFIDNEIVIQDPTPQCSSFFYQKLTFKNPEYEKKKRLGLWLGNVDPEITLMKRIGESIVIPFGMLGYVLRNRNLFESIENRLKTPVADIDYKSSINPYDYQEQAILAALKRRNGVIIAPCGSGKTQIGIEIIARLGMRALWLTHTGDLLKQSMERAKSVLGAPEEWYGTITDGKVNIGKSITFATVQTMCKIDLADIKDYFDVIIVDEAHHIVGTPTRLQMFYKVISKLSARYKFGLTATPTRADGLIGCMYALLGSAVYEVTKAQVKESLCPVRVFIKYVEYTPDFSVVLAPDGTLQYSALISDMTQNEARNRQIIEDIATHKGRGLVLTDRVQHIGVLANALKALDLRCATLHGSVKKEIREKTMADLVDGNIDLIIATYALAKEGLDIPNLDNVFFVTPQKNETTVVQSAGRTSRKAAGKQWGNVYDYVDNFGMLRGWASKRRSLYKKNDFYIEYTT